MYRIIWLIFLLVSTLPNALAGRSRAHDALLHGKSKFTETSLERFLTNLRRLNDIQQQIAGLRQSNRFAFKGQSDAVAMNPLDVEPKKPYELPYLFEGDIILTDMQMEHVVHTAEEELEAKRVARGMPRREPAQDSGSHRERRSLTSDLALRWTTFPIPYYINTATGVNVAAVQAGVRRWMQETCITFEQYYSPVRDRPSLEFIKGDGCYSYIGEVSSTGQQISIGLGCTDLGTVAHEIGHSLGFYHEQARWDRDSYVTVLTQNVVPSMLSQFSKQSRTAMTDYGVPYDYGSAMHYDQTAFSANGRPTIQTSDGNYQYTIGQRVAPSFSDVKRINFAYCNSSCANSLSCQYGGYTDPNDCSRCRCPDGLGGRYCTEASVTTSDCGATNFNAISELRSISRAGAGTCNYVISAPPGRKIYFQIVVFQFEREVPCAHSYLEVKYRSNLATTGARLCATFPTSPRVTEGEKLILIYKGTDSTQFAINFRYGNFVPRARPKPAGRKPEGPAIPGNAEDDPHPVVGVPLTDIDWVEVADPTTSTSSTTTTTTTTTTPTTTARKTTTTPRPTTRRTATAATTTTGAPPPPTTTPSNCSSWSDCTALCGGCGTQTRVCNGHEVVTQYCNTAPCRTEQGPWCCRPFYYVVQGFCVRPLLDRDVIQDELNKTKMMRQFEEEKKKKTLLQKDAPKTTTRATTAATSTMIAPPARAIVTQGNATTTAGKAATGNNL